MRFSYLASTLLTSLVPGGYDIVRTVDDVCFSTVPYGGYPGSAFTLSCCIHGVWVNLGFASGFFWAYLVVIHLAHGLAIDTPGLRLHKHGQNDLDVQYSEYSEKENYSPNQG